MPRVRLVYEVREIMTGKLVARSATFTPSEANVAFVRVARSLFPVAIGYQHSARQVDHGYTKGGMQ